MKNNKLSQTLLLLLLIGTVVLLSCKEPFVGPPVYIEAPKPFTVSTDSLRFTITQNDDIENVDHPEFILARNEVADSNYIIIDTSDVVPKLSMHVRFQQAKTTSTNTISNFLVDFDSVSVTGTNRTFLNNENVIFIVRKEEKPITYGRLAVVQTKAAPYSKEDNFAEIFPWKVTAQKEIRMSFQAQMKYKANLNTTPTAIRARVGGTISIRY